MFHFLKRAVMGGVMGAALAAVVAVVPASAQNKKINVVATTGMIADTVKQVGGGRVEVKALMKPGVDPHVYRQTRSDIAAMVKADAVFWHGLYLEAQLEGFLEDLAKRKPVIALAENLPKDQLLPSEEYENRFDPHVWMNPRLWKIVVNTARDQLTKLDPAGKADFAANAERHIAEIDALAAYSDKVLGTVPEASRVFISAHDAFGYFGKAYNYEVMGIQGVSTESEAGLKHIEDLVNLLVDRKIGAIFVESSVSDRNVKALTEGAAARDHKVIVGGELFSDSMGAPGTYEGTYIGMIDHNATVIARALGGEAPKTGLNGKLAH